MEHIDYHQISCLVDEGDVNFIAFVTSPWHLIGAKAAIEYIKKEGIEVKPIIISTPHPETGYAVTMDDEYDIYQLNNYFSKTSIIKYVSFLFWCWRTSSKCDAQLFFANAWYGRFKRIFWILSSFRKIFKIIIFEEGIGAYFNEHYRINSILYNRNFLQKIQVAVDLSLSRRFTKSGRIINLNPLEYNEESQLVFNEVAIEMYRRTLKIKALELEERKVIILTQELDDEIYRVVNNISQYLISCSVDVYIKAHPRFPIDDSLINKTVHLVDHSVAIESLLQTMKTKYVISFNTTSLLSLRYFYDVTTISILHLVREDCCQGLFNCQGSFNKWFETTCSNMVHFPKNIKEFQKIFVGLSAYCV